MIDIDVYLVHSAKDYELKILPSLMIDIDVCLATRPFLLGDDPGLADFALLPFIRQFANVDVGWFEAQPYTQLQRWLEGLLDSEIFIEAMGKYPPWKRGDSITVF